MIYHVVPVNDLEDHIDCSTCHCGPVSEVQPSGGIIIIHNSFDGREGLELANEVLNK